jgi:hypothetical protein
MHEERTGFPDLLRRSGFGVPAAGAMAGLAGLATWRYPYWGQFYSLSHLGLARGSALAGDTAKAKKAFQDFFELWKDADPGLPILQQAKAEYAELR